MAVGHRRDMPSPEIETKSDAVENNAASQVCTRNIDKTILPRVVGVDDFGAHEKTDPKEIALPVLSSSARPTPRLHYHRDLLVELRPTQRAHVAHDHQQACCGVCGEHDGPVRRNNYILPGPPTASTCPSPAVAARVRTETREEVGSMNSSFTSSSFL
ncbi:uncharacterized protein PgNI_02266 [Pyricularia grisea]|uniref:Uncharacterized protein n=1 Tax=Pyricularia grisea TaxID=148305 RepID=A0A6P8BGK7_PYRGI|nr:uncharacterized protein PgNI_02266 [Pyricularia grisea]TLD15845.1 hypothetical protein PgNI_02266 [Pyricularia grisea]